MVRQYNGLSPVVVCALEPMNYYLYDGILQAVEKHKKETGDERIFCLKFGAIDIWKEGYDAAMHPNIRTHQRIGQEMVKVRKPWLKSRRLDAHLQ